MTDLLRGDLHFALVLEEEFQDRLHHAWNVDLEFVPHPGHYLLYEENDGVLEVLVLGRPELLGDEGGAERGRGGGRGGKASGRKGEGERGRGECSQGICQAETAISVGGLV